MASNERPELIDLAAKVADGTSVDWRRASEDPFDDRELLEGLRLLERIAEVHGSLTASAQSSISSDNAESHRSDSADGADPPQWGQLLIAGRLGRGSFGTVYRAWDPRLDRSVALKLLADRKELAATTETLPDSAIVEEGRLLARVRHPSVITVYGADHHEGRVGVWMELLEGRTLEAEVRERGPLPAREVVAIGIHVADALAAVHRAGLIHRDVKAQNVMREADGRIVLMDFGAGINRAEVTDGTTLAGTPLYLAPELIDGAAATVRSDVYSLGVLLYHLATGSFPVPGRTLREVRRAHARGDRRALASVRGDLPRPVARTIERALSVAPEHRFADAEAFAAALRGVHVRAARYRHAAIIAGAAIVLIVAAVTITKLLSGRPNEESRAGAGVSMDQIDPTVQQRFQIRGPSFGGGFAPCVDRRERELGICNLRTGEIDVLRRPTQDAGPVDQPMPRALISPDGERLAYLWTHQSPDGSAVDALHVIELRTRRDQELHRSVVMELTRWTPDGTAIVARDGRDETGKYVRIPIDGRQPHTLLQLTPDDDRHGDLSPDGRTMLIARVSAAGDRDLFGIDVATGEERWSRKEASDDADPRWMPDGTGIVFVTDLAGCESLAVLRMNGAAPERNPVLQLPFGATRTRLYGFGPDGSLLIDQSPYSYSTWRGSVDLGRATVSSARLLRQSQCDMAMGADWSPDRSRVSYVAGRPVPGARARLVIERPEGMNREEIVLEHPFVTFAQTRWTPDGQRLAVLYRTGRPLTGPALEVLTIVDARERQQQTLLREPIAESGLLARTDPAWDPTGTALYFRDGKTIVRVNLQAPKPEFKDAYHAPDGEALDRGLDVSRTGALAVGHVRVIGTAPKQQLGTDCVLRVVRSDAQLLYRRSVPGSCQSLTWTRDGRRIVVATRTAEKSVLWLIDPVSDSETPLDAAVPEPNFFHLSLHPDDDRLLFMAGRSVQRPNMIHVRGLR